MPNKFIRSILFVATAVFLASGCTSGGLSARSYVEDKPRVDQDMTAGSGYNYGYLGGTPVPEDRSSLKKTRKVYVFEVTKEVPGENIDVSLPPRRHPAPPPAPAPMPSKSSPAREYQPIVIPPIEDVPVTPSGPQTYEEYTVEKGDTLQKISKKYYDSFAKWKRIQEANPDVLKDPNKIKPGMKIRVPLD